MERQLPIRRENIGPFTEFVSCQSCRKRHGTSEPSYCEDCFEILQRTKEETDRMKKELEVKISFLTMIDHDQFPADCFLIVVADGSEGTPSAPIPIHKLILASRSPVFKAMLEHPMEESQSGKIIIKEASHEAVKCFVNYLYSAVVSLGHLDQLALELLALAERYQVMQLKDDCENFMLSNVTWKNSISIYMFAHMHNANGLKEAALSLIKENRADLRKHPDYRPLANKNPGLVIKMLEACLFPKEERNATVNSSA